MLIFKCQTCFVLELLYVGHHGKLQAENHSSNADVIKWVNDEKSPYNNNENRSHKKISG